ncbi:MAG: tRNA (guanosine(46)-N7)-methyltransferase TrmB [Bacteroidales bacterium]|jgi:tRNA (guanine-N7-)-methyltransferase|nr:tRNA (guanosine(46)-N7)-methyltransferase TrmB [Bacteroidales bacterium]
MSNKKKLLRFAENKTFTHFFEPKLFLTEDINFELSGIWAENFFKNENPIIVEFGCGKGEYSVEMAKNSPEKNFIAFDIKGARMWKGATESLNLKLTNIAFVRTLIDLTPKCFSKNEISEIWLTFPDPQLGHKKRIKKRLTSSIFLKKYQNFLTNNGIIHLKTDDDTLFSYTKELVELNNLKVNIETDDLYNSNYYTGILQLKTHYEKIWNKAGKTIKYIQFQLPNNIEIIEPLIKEN